MQGIWNHYTAKLTQSWHMNVCLYVQTGWQIGGATEPTYLLGGGVDNLEPTYLFGGADPPPPNLPAPPRPVRNFHFLALRVVFYFLGHMQ